MFTKGEVFTGEGMRNKGKVKKKDHQEKWTQEPDIKTQREFSLQDQSSLAFIFVSLHITKVVLSVLLQGDKSRHHL